jgi:hypothetical protein
MYRLLLTVSLTTPWNLAFQSDKEPTYLSLFFDIFVDIFFTIDMIIIFNTAYVDEGQNLIDDRKVRVLQPNFFG